MVVAIGFVACGIDDEGYVFDGTGGAGPAPATGGSSTGGAGGSRAAAGGSAATEAGALGDGGEGASGGVRPLGTGGVGGTTGGDAAAPSAGTSGAPNPATGGAGGATPPEGCQSNQLCARVTVGDEFPNEKARLVVVLYEAPPVVTADSLPWPLATYPELEVSLSPDRTFSLQQDFTKTAWGGDYAGERYVAVVAFFSNEPRQARPGKDYWYVAPEPVALALDEAIDLGEVQLALVPVVDDPDSAGNDAAGLVRCIARRHDQAGEGSLCDVSANICCIFQEDGGSCGSAACAEDQGELEHTCDGPEDCDSGQICCGEPMRSHRCTAEGDCTARRVCHTSGDCVGVSTVCAPSPTGIADVGYCVGLDPETPGDDRPGMVQCTDELVCATWCCADFSSGTAECDPPSNGCGFSSLYCDGPEDCVPPQSCCRGQDLAQRCNSSCSRATVCHTDSDCPAGECAADGLCVSP